MNEEENLLFL